MIAATYIINLPESTVRWRAMQTILAETGLPGPIRWKGVDGAALDAQSLGEYQRSGMLGFDLSGFDSVCRIGEIGCALSHLGVLRDIVEKGWPAALILEDDVALAGEARTWRARFARAYADLPSIWEMWYLYRCFDIRHRVRRLTRRTVIPWTPQGAAAYAVTQAGARKLLQAVTPVRDAIDRMYSVQVVRKEGIEVYAASPLLFLPGDQPSIVNRDAIGRKWVENGVNKPPEYWPFFYYRYLGEPRWRQWQLWLAAAAVVIAVSTVVKMGLR